MRTFMDEHFLLTSGSAVYLFDSVKKLPIIDFHTLLDAKVLAENKTFNNITELCLRAAPQKWRIMRQYGIPESYVTGDAPDFDKFASFCEAVSECVGSPVYHLTHMELKKYFDFHGEILAENAQEIFEQCNNIIIREELSPITLLQKSRVEWIATKDCPTSNLEHHRKIKEMKPGFDVYPAFCPNEALDIEKATFPAYIEKLGESAGVKISDFGSLCEALISRLDFFASKDCITTWQSLEPFNFIQNSTSDECDRIFKKTLGGTSPTPLEAAVFKTKLICWLGIEYYERNMVMQLEFGTRENDNRAQTVLLGAGKGFDTIADNCFTDSLSLFLNELEQLSSLPRTIIHSQNPSAGDSLATLCGSFAGGGNRGKIQWSGSGAFGESITGIKKHLTTLASHGLISTYVGPHTSSGNFLSFIKHDYYRRILVDKLGEWADNGEFPRDMVRLRSIAEGISYYNAKLYFE